MTFVILHTQSRFILGMTIDQNLELPATASLVQVPAGWTPDRSKANQGWIKLDVDNLTCLTPTQQEIDDSNLDETAEQRKQLLRFNRLADQIDVIINAGAPISQQNMLIFMQRLKVFLRGL